MRHTWEQANLCAGLQWNCCVVSRVHVPLILFKFVVCIHTYIHTSTYIHVVSKTCKLAAMMIFEPLHLFAFFVLRPESNCHHSWFRRARARARQCFLSHAFAHTYSSRHDSVVDAPINMLGIPNLEFLKLHLDMHACMLYSQSIATINNLSQLCT